MAEEHNLEPDNTEPDPLSGSAPQGAHSPSALSPGGLVPAAIPVVAKGMTPGQRLAAKKAQKAVDKKDFKEDLKQKEKDAQEQAQAQAQANTANAEPALPEEVQKVASDFSDFVHENQGRIIGGIVAFIVISVTVILAQRFMSTGNAEAANALESAIEISTAPIDAEEKDGKTDDGKPVFATREDRTKKAAGAFAGVSKKFADDDIAPWPLAADGAGPSLEVIDVNGNYNNPLNWRASASADGTPGGATRLAEPDTDGDGSPDWMEEAFGLPANSPGERPAASVNYSGGLVTITWPFADGYNYQVEASPALLSWQVIATVAGGSYQDPDSAAMERRYYRIRAIPQP